MNSDIVFRTGVDTRPFSVGMRSLTRIAKDAGNTIRDGLKSSFGTFLSGAALVGLGNRLGNLADEVKGAGEAFGTSTDFVQGFRTAVSQNSGTVANANKGMEQLALLLGQGSEKFAKWGISLNDANGRARSTEEIIKAIADKMSTTASGTERAAIAFDLFGKSGKTLIPTLIQGGTALQDYIDAADKMDSQQLRDIADAQDKIKLSMDKVTLAAGNTIGWITQLSGAYKRLMADENVAGENLIDAAIRAFAGGANKTTSTASDGAAAESESSIRARASATKDLASAKMSLFKAQLEEFKSRASDKEKLSLLKQQMGAVENLAKKQKEGSEERLKLDTEWLNLRKELNDLNDSILAKEQRISDEKKSQLQSQLEANAAVANAQKNLNNARGDRSKFDSVESLADSMAPGARGAAQVLELERQADYWKNSNDPNRKKLMEDRLSRADKIRSGLNELTENARDPFAALQAQLKSAQETAKATTELNAKISGKK